MTRWTSEAVVLRYDAQGESDLRIMLMTPGQGRVAAWAKGALRSHKRFAGVFETGRLITAGLMVAPKTGRVMVEHAAIVDPLSNLRRHPLAVARACLLLEIVSLTAGEGEAAAGLYSLLRRGLLQVDREPDHDRWSVTYAYRLLAEAGYRPSLECCVHCHDPGPGSGPGPDFLFSPAGGGVVCPACLQLPYRQTNLSRGDCLPVAPDVIRTLTALLDLPPDQLHRVSFTRRALAQARSLLGPFIAFHLGQVPFSLRLLAEMKS